MNILLITYILAPLLAALLCLLFKPAKIAASLAAASYCALLSLRFALTSPRLIQGIFVFDGLSQLFLLVIGLAAVCILVFSMSYMEKYPDNHSYYALYCLLIASMNGVVLSSNLLALFIFLEAASFITYFLVAYGKQDIEVEAAFKYFVLSAIASSLLLLGIILLNNLAGTLSMPQITMNTNKLYPAWSGFIFSLFVLGFGLKAALVPFHAWLPDAHTCAPAPVSATLSGVLIKVLGFYCLIRFIFNVFPLSLNFGASLVLLGSASILIGGLMALVQNDMKRLYAYSSISQVGYIALGLGLLSPLGILGALLHLFNHAFFKPLLFLTSGAIETQTHTRKLDELGGLFTKMPFTSFSALIGNLSLAGIPPFSGFWSKFLIILACVKLGKFGLAFIAALGALLSLGYVLKVLKAVFFDKLPQKLVYTKEACLSMLIAMLALSALCIFIGVLNPMIVQRIINPAAIVVINKLAYAAFAAGKI